MTKTNKIVAILGVLVVLATIVCLCLIGCLNNQNTNLANKDNDSGFMVNEDKSNGIDIVKTALLASDYEVYGVSAMAESAYSINATIDPADAVDQGLNWSINWATPDSTWANGKNVSDYVTYSLTNSNKTATVSCLQPFGTQIIIKAAANCDNSIFATCTLDYSQKVTNATLNFGNINVNLGGETEIKYEIAKTVDGMGGIVAANIETSEVYSIAENYTKSVKIKPIENDGVSSFFKLKNSTITGLNYYVDAECIGKSIYYDYKHDIVDWMIFDRYNDILFDKLTTAEIADYFSNITQPILYEVIYTVTGIHNTYTYKSTFKCVGFTNNTPVNSIGFSNTEFVF